MPTLKELRVWLQGEKVASDLPDKTEKEVKKNVFTKALLENTPVKLFELEDDDGEDILDEVLEDDFDVDGVIGVALVRPSVSIEKMKKSKKDKTWKVRYSINIEGDDAVLKFGQFEDSLLTDIVSNGHSSYLRWMQKQPFPDDLLEVVEHVLRTKKGY